MKLVLFSLLCISFTSLLAQTNLGTITGVVVEKGSEEPIPFANVALFNDKELVKRSYTNFQGEFILDSLLYGAYKVQVSYVGFSTNTVKNISVPQKRALKISLKGDIVCGWVYPLYNPPLLEKDNNTIQQNFTKIEIQRLANF